MEKFFRYWLILIILFPLCRASWITLENGKVIHGTIVKFDEQKLLVERLDQKGMLEFPWSKLHPICREKLQIALGLKQSQQLSDLIEGVNVFLRSGGSIQGRLILKKKSYIELRTKNAKKNYRIARKDYYKVDKIQIPLVDYYSQEEIYRKFKYNFDLKTAEGNLAFARFLLKVANYSQSSNHIEKAQALDSKLLPKIEILQKEIKLQKEQQEQQALLQKIQYYRLKNQYSKATELLESIKESITKQQYHQLSEEIIARRQKYLNKNIPKQWIKQLSKKIRQVAGKSPLEEARDYIENKLSSDIVQELALKYECEEQTIKEIFDNRKPFNRRQYNYKDGTFIIAPAYEGDKDLEFDNEFSVSMSSVESNISSEEWWQEASQTKKTEWLQAYYWEKVLESKEIVSRKCFYCQGSGKTFQKKKAVACEICNGCGHERIVIAK